MTVLALAVEIACASRFIVPLVVEKLPAAYVQLVISFSQCREKLYINLVGYNKSSKSQLAGSTVVNIVSSFYVSQSTGRREIRFRNSTG